MTMDVLGQVAAVSQGFRDWLASSSTEVAGVDLPRFLGSGDPRVRLFSVQIWKPKGVGRFLSLRPRIRPRVPRSVPGSVPAFQDPLQTFQDPSTQMFQDPSTQMFQDPSTQMFQDPST